MAAPALGGLAALVDFVEVENLGAVPDFYGWAGIEGDIVDFRSVRGLIHRALGNPVNIGDLAFVSFSDLEDVLRDLQVPALSSDVPERSLNPVERARARRALAGAVAYETARPASSSASASTGAPAPAASKKTKLSSLVDITADAELVKVSDATIRNMYVDYCTVRGDHPHEDIEPTDEQLSALHQLIVSGSAPYADFSIWGPHGRRMLKRMVLSAHSYDVSTGGVASSRAPRTT